jgi:hypothetical protein
MMSSTEPETGGTVVSEFLRFAIMTMIAR